MDQKERPHHCAICNQSFTRSSHLKRHTRLHEGSYRCLCGQTFSRNDALSRHLRRCTTAQRNIEGIKPFESISSKKQTRDKRACDNCANLKLKCTLQLPCDQCRRRSLTCTCTRDGYVDPYESFRVGKEQTSQLLGKTREPLGSSSMVVDLPLDKPQPILNEASAYGLENVHGETLRYGLSQQMLGLTEVPGTTSLSALAHSGIETSSVTSVPDTADWPSMDLSVTGFDFASDLIFPFASVHDTNIPSLSFDLTQQVDPLISENWAYVTGEGQNPGVASTLPPPPPSNGFTLRQLDPVEAKCTDIRELLLGAEPIIDAEYVSKYITRGNLLFCGQLFGSRLSRNIPILHSPIFMLTEAPPMLLLAVILGGACYSSDAIPAKYVTKFAKGLLILIERQQHEIDMQVPRISTVQASVIACCILLSSRYEGARRFASVHFARCISMADRLGVFKGEKSFNYANLTEEGFNWQSWIEQESRRRVACEIFILDMAFCVFLGKSPYFSAFDFLTQMPCPEKCWEATNSAACFRSLRDLPPQIKVSTAMYELYSLGEEEHGILEVSEFGLFVLMLALHSSLLRIIQEEPEPHPFPRSINTLFPGMELVSMMRQQLIGEDFTVLADTIVEAYGSPAMKECNKTLKTWRRIWDQFQVRNWETKIRPFSADPLPFWYLAKLYQVLYLCSDLFGGEADFKVPMRRGDHDRWKMEDHDKIIAWLNDFREQTSSNGPGARKSEPAFIHDAQWGVNVLSKLMKPA